MEILDEEKMPLRHDSNPEVSINNKISLGLQKFLQISGFHI